MNLYAKQRGISFSGLLLTLVVLGFVGLIGLKLFPVYMESFKIDAALKSVVEDPDIAKRSKKEIYQTLEKRFDIDDVESIRYNELTDKIKIVRDKGKVTITATYQRRAPLFFNLTLLADFKKVVQN